MKSLRSWFGKAPWIRKEASPPPRMSRLRWLAGVSFVWFLTWLLLGLRVAFRFKDRPHPFLPQVEFGPIVIQAALTWAFSALAVYLGIGLVLSLVAKLATSDRHGSDLAKHLSFRDGLRAGAGTLIFFHGVLFTMVPMALVSLPGIKKLPMALALLLFLGVGGFLLWRMMRREAASFPALRALLLLAFLAGLPQIPHDVVRKRMPLPPPLPPDAPRVLVIGIDGARKDLVERYMPSWKAPNDVNSVCATPATRRSWSLLLGKDPDKLRNSVIMPFRRDFGHPEEFELLNLARQKGLRTAWAIDDSLTAGFGNQPNLFTTVRESPGGWKYWFTLGMGTIFPVYSWAQNYAAPIENTNPWADIDAYYRDLERLTETHHWVFSHTCTLHEPIRITLGEFQKLRPWIWLLDSAWSYRPYEDTDQPVEDPSRLDLRSSALYHYSARLHRVVTRLDPMLRRWEARFPHLSGIVTADHGEFHLPLENEKDEVLSHLEGFHGFTLEPNTMWVPMHPFGETRHEFKPGQMFTWVELRDAMQRQAVQGGPLVLAGREEPFLTQILTIRARHLENEEERNRKEDLGIDPKELVGTINIMADGLWFASDPPEHELESRKLSSCVTRGRELLIFNPVSGGKYERLLFDRYKLVRKDVVTPEAAAEEIAGFRKHYPGPMPQQGSSTAMVDASRPQAP